MTRPARRLPLAAALAAATLLGLAAPAAAGELGGLEVSVKGTTVVLKNEGAEPCRVARTALGTVVLNRVEQDGKAAEPAFSDVSFADGVEASIVRRLHTLDPGASLDLPLRVVPFGATGSAIQTVAASTTTGPVAAFHPIASDRPLKLDVTYSVAVDPGPGPRLCAAASGVSSEAALPGDGQGDDEDGGLPLPLVAGGAAAALVALLLVVVLLRRRRGSAGTVAAIALIAAAGVASDAGTARDARAVIKPASGVATAYADCIKMLREPGHDPAGILPTLDAPGFQVDVLPANGDDTHESGLEGQSFIFWDTEARYPYYGTGGNADPCTSLYHELFHSYERAKGTLKAGNCVTADGDSGIPEKEVNATRAQNKLRVALGMPPRSHYGNKPLPTKDCLPPDKRPKPKQCGGKGCGSSNGDPHLVTFDGRRYDFQAVGEFVSARDPNGGFEVQVRQQPAVGSRLASVNTAVAMAVGTNRVEVRSGPDGVVLLVGGLERPVGPVDLPGGGSVDLVRGPYGAAPEVTWPDGSYAIVSPIGRWGVHLVLQPSTARAGRLEGLLGNFDDDPANDVRPRGGGTPIADATHANLYPAYADSWRIEQSASLFTYGPGETTGTFTDPSMPEKPVGLDDLPSRAAAEALCRRMGVVEENALRDCVFDVAITGQPDFATAALGTQVYLAGAGGPAAQTLRIPTPGAVAKLTFDGRPGTVVFVDVPSATLPDECGVLYVSGPDGKRLQSGCVIRGEGSVDRVPIPAAGTYTVTIDPHGQATGEARVRVVTTSDDVQPTTTDGAERGVAADQPGEHAGVTFDGTAGEAVFLQVTDATFRDECGLLYLVGPDGKRTGAGCVIGGKGYLDRVELPLTGRWTARIDTHGRGTGEATVRVFSVRDAQASVSIGGETEVTLDRPGSVARVTFEGRAGQVVVVQVPETTVPDSCSPLALLGPRRESLGRDCVIGGKGSMRPVTLPADGRYTVVVDPAGADTGRARVVVRPG